MEVTTEGSMQRDGLVSCLVPKLPWRELEGEMEWKKGRGGGRVEVTTEGSMQRDGLVSCLCHACASWNVL